MLCRGESFVKLGLAFEKLADSGLYVVTSVSPSGLVFQKLKVGDVLHAVNGVMLRNKKLSDIVALLSGPKDSMLAFEIIAVDDSLPQTPTQNSKLKIISIKRMDETDSPSGYRGI